MNARTWMVRARLFGFPIDTLVGATTAAEALDRAVVERFGEGASFVDDGGGLGVGEIVRASLRRGEWRAIPIARVSIVVVELDGVAA